MPQEHESGWVRLTVKTIRGAAGQTSISMDALLYTLLVSRTGNSQAAMSFIQRCSLAWDHGRLVGSTRSKAISRAAILLIAEPVLVSETLTKLYALESESHG